ncbi:HAD family hydrolase [Peptoniphilus catoniae]|uniref:HAD family hydrolase n=1 Tax=Peptoniphilus catoniae TaxID=1660341 RepID=UPI0010FD250A|nr:HAD family phosphatase [Peptoniphilus catoniae]
MKGIIFDLDGTLIDSMGMYRNLSKNYLKNLGVDLTDDVAQKTTVMGLGKSVEFIVDYYKLDKEPEEIYQDYKNIVADFYENKALAKEKSIETLTKYYDLGYKLALGTATNMKFLNHVFKRFNIKDYFDVIQTVDDVGVKKSEKEFFEILAAKLGLDTEDVMLFDDAPYALKAAKKSGMVTIAVYDESAKDYWEASKAGNDYYIESFKDWAV